MPLLDLARAAVFLDYDGTISTRDTGVALLEEFAPPAWRTIDEEYTRGEIGSRVCLLDEWDLLPKDEARLRAAAAAVPLDPGLDDLVTALRAAGA
jgi:2-hydroxy-3-keto-5-methylthiopentenyl-1-phosphate phosphatase